MASRTELLAEAVAEIRTYLVDETSLVRAVASGRRRGAPPPPWRRVELRYVDLSGTTHLQVTAYDATQAHTSNHRVGQDAVIALDGLLAEPFGSWHVETTSATHQLRVTKRGLAAVHSAAPTAEQPPDRAHDRTKARLLSEEHPVFQAVGVADQSGRVRPRHRPKLRQVDEFLRLLDGTVSGALASGHLRRPTPTEPLRVVDLGCGNSYLSFAAHAFLTDVRGLPVVVTGVDVKEQSRLHHREVAARLGVDSPFARGTIAEVALDPWPEVVLALHACDTATDEALARAVEWHATVVLAAPCCHHDIAAQMRDASPPAGYGMLLRHGILRERLADTLTDALRASLLRERGYRVDVVEFVESRHTPRNTLLRAVRTGTAARSDVREEYDDLVAAWQLRPRLAELLDADA